MEKLNHFNDYRDLIGHFFKLKKASQKGCSFQQFSLKAGTSRSYLKLVIDKKRHISSDRLLPISKFLGFSEYQKNFLTFLFFANTTSDATLAESFRVICERLSRLTEGYQLYSEDLKFGEHQGFLYSWVEMAIYTMAFDSRFKADPKWIHRRLGGDQYVSINIVESCLKSLIDQKLLIQKDAKWFPKEKLLQTNTDPVLSINMTTIASVLQRVKLGVDMQPDILVNKPGHFQIYALSCSPAELKSLHALYMDFNSRLQDFIAQCSNEGPQRVVLVSNNVVPISTLEE